MKCGSKLYNDCFLYGVSESSPGSTLTSIIVTISPGNIPGGERLRVVSDCGGDDQAKVCQDVAGPVRGSRPPDQEGLAELCGGVLASLLRHLVQEQLPAQ